MIDAIKIPDKRKAILIGEKGSIKKKIEVDTKTSIKISEDIEINGEAIDVMISKQVIKAIGRGFSPEISLKLINDDNILYIINISDDKTSLKRIKSRLIGTSGKVRKNLEKFSDTSISIYGKTISIIGEHENVEKAINAINKIIDGAPHKNAYRLLEKGSKMVI